MGELNLISLGLYDKEDISVKALKKAKSCDIVYLEGYTHFLNISCKDLSKFIGKKIINLYRADLENGSKKLISNAKMKKIGILIGGDCLSATTHQSLILEAKKENIKTNIIHGSSIFTTIAETGLFIYNFGKVASIPFENENIKTPIKILKDNQKINAHSLILLDLNPKNNKFLTIKEACSYLIKNGIKSKIVVCARLGSKNFEIKYGNLEKLEKEDFGEPPYCLIIPGKKLHFVEEESLEKWIV